MKNKRLEIYLGWTCNKKCIFCSEYNIMEKNWNKKVKKEEILLQLLKYKKLGYNHVTFLGGEPFIQNNFLFALKISKKLGYKVLVTTNTSTLQIHTQAKKYLPYIDELILSIHSIDNIINKKIFQIGKKIDYDEVFKNIYQYWKGSLLKVNTIINPYNLDEIINIIDYLNDKKVTEISITFPDVYENYYSDVYKKEKIFVNYSKLKDYLVIYYKKSIENNIVLKFVDIPFCVLPNIEMYSLTDDYVYENRLKIDVCGNELNRKKVSPRNRKHIEKCKDCTMNKICWGPSVEYIKLYGDEEISFIKNNLGIK